jgi:hypothetical protein
VKTMRAESGNLTWLNDLCDLRRRYPTKCVLAVLWTVLLIIVFVKILPGPEGPKFSDHIDWDFVVTVPLFVLGLLQLVRLQQIERAKYVKELLTDFHSNQETKDAFFDLIYSYPTAKYRDVKAKLKKLGYERNGNRKFNWKHLEDFNQDRKEGQRIYHPWFFQGSLEERRVDGVLDYFNSVGLFCKEGLVTIQDVVGVLGDQLHLIAEKEVMIDYLDYCAEEPVQFPHLLSLVHDYKRLIKKKR